MTRTVATQKGLHLRAANHLVSEVPVPVPPADHNAIQTATYASLLKGTDPQHLLFAEVPLSEALGRRVVLVYDASGSGAPNAVASRLTTGVHDGLALQISGDALAFYAKPHTDLGQVDWQALDNAIYDELAEYFQQGLSPSEGDIATLVANFRAGRYDYNRRREGEEGVEANKDDGGLDLADALAEP
ncbi:expressed protein isoform B [Micractinium conductrix]|uniref:Expressed protein isoform A n=1 Tax=Micractinium conductrix TaxID=554055 RepID=A0A2P6V3F6_9CHLO|nr:expressed protein isoform A [Micractinium conductrix]PSC68616.1 expressed protein isoform B [Micractinium conductrix]|eukprot:PSC68615.1 expressed protein isoform A [Micractinium conductrix]